MRIEYRSPTLSEYTKLRVSVGWRKTEDKATETDLKNSLFSLVAFDNGDVVGIGRIIGDGGLYFYIQDLIVHPEYQNKGLGKTLINELLHYIKTNAKRGAFVCLMAAKGYKKYYEQFGYMARDADAPGMYQIIK